MRGVVCLGLLLALSACDESVFAVPGGMDPGRAAGRDLAPGDSWGGLDLVGTPPRPPDFTPCPETPSPLGIAAFTQAMVGTWEGPTTNEWVPPYTSRLTFTADGHYSAHALTGTAPALYSGIDADDPSKTFTITRVLANGDGRGTLVLFFGPANTLMGALEHVRICRNGGGDRLDFEFFFGDLVSGRRGPVTFRLARQ